MRLLTVVAQTRPHTADEQRQTGSHEGKHALFTGGWQLADGRIAVVHDLGSHVEIVVSNLRVSIHHGLRLWVQSKTRRCFGFHHAQLISNVGIVDPALMLDAVHGDGSGQVRTARGDKGVGLAVRVLIARSVNRASLDRPLATFFGATVQLEFRTCHGPLLVRSW